jgi:hypothetical protein
MPDYSGMTVAAILKGKLGSIKRAPLPPQTPSWETILAMKWEEIVEHASKNRPGFKVFKKLLKDARFDK